MVIFTGKKVKENAVLTLFLFLRRKVWLKGSHAPLPETWE